MVDLSRDTDRALDEGRALLRDNRSGGRHRLAGTRSIGRASAKMKAGHALLKLRNIALALAVILIGFSALGVVLGGIGFAGLMGAIVLAAIAVGVFSSYPSLKVPERADLKTDDVRRLVGQTELWLEAQRRALPPPAAKAISQIGLQLDGLQLQLEEVDQAHPMAAQIRKLVGEDLPEMIEGYRRIPEHLRYEEHAGSNPNKQLMEGLGLISAEIDSVTRQLAAGALDDLAIRTRYLDYKYGEAEHAAPEQN